MSFRASSQYAISVFTISLASALTPAPISAAETNYLIRNELFCSTSKNICIRGSLSYDVNPRLLALNGRVQRATGPGTLLIYLSGENRNGHRRVAEMEMHLLGHYSEIIDYKSIPDHPDIITWEVETILFDEDSSDNRQTR